MGNQVAQFKTGGVPATPDDLVKGLQNVSGNIAASTGGVPFLRLTKQGFFAYGAEKIEIEPGSRWAVNPYAIQHGYACWGDGELLGEVMVPFNQQLPSTRELPNHGPKWAMQVSLQLQCVSGEDTGVAVIYKGTSRGLQAASKELIQDILSQVQHDAEHIVPVLELEVDSYDHKKYGETFVPILKIVDWISMTGPEEEDAGALAEAESDDPPASEPEDPPADPPPSRRRRRSASADKKEDKSDAKEGGTRRRRRRGSS